MEMEEETVQDVPAFAQSARMAFSSIRKAILPGYVLLFLAAVFVYAYYNVPSIYEFMERIGGLKREWGYGFSMMNSAFFGGLMPWAFRMLLPGQRPSRVLAYLLFGLILWGIQGVTVDTLYRVQGMVFGTEVTFGVVACKVLVDQFGYSLVFSSILNSNAYYWADEGYSFTAWKRTLSMGWKGWYKRIVLPNYLANLTIWLPGVCIIYCLPPDLQIFMAGLISCFYSLIAMYIASGSSRR